MGMHVHSRRKRKKTGGPILPASGSVGHFDFEFDSDVEFAGAPPFAAFAKGGSLRSCRCSCRCLLALSCHPEAQRGICFLRANSEIHSRRKRKKQRAFRQGTASAVPKANASGPLPLGTGGPSFPPLEAWGFSVLNLILMLNLRVPHPSPPLRRVGAFEVAFSL